MTAMVATTLTERLAALALAVPALLLTAGTAQASPLPEPEPVPVGPVEQSAPVLESPAGEVRVAAPEVGGSQSSSTGSYLDPVNTVPNINGDPCTGAWESTACYAMNFDTAPAVQPRSTLSASP